VQRGVRHRQMPGACEHPPASKAPKIGGSTAFKRAAKRGREIIKIA